MTDSFNSMYLSPIDLAQYQQTATTQNPWVNAASSINQWQPNYNVMSPGEGAATAFGRAFLGSIMQNYGQNQVAGQLDTVVQSLPQLMANPYSMQVPEGLNANAFGQFRGNAILRKAQLDAAQELSGKQELGDMIKAVTGKAIDAGQIDPVKLLGVLDPKYSGLSQDSGKNPLLGVPKDLQTDVKKEMSIDQAKAKSLEFITSKFDQAKDLVGANAALGSLTSSLSGIPTDKSQALQSLGDSIVVQVDTALGRELNSDVRNRLLSLAPKWFDSKEEIERKKADTKELVSSLFAPTPISESLGLAQPTAAPSPPPALGGLPEIGSDFNGEKVLSIRKVR